MRGVNDEVACEKRTHLKLVHTCTLGALRRSAALEDLGGLVVGEAPRARLEQRGFRIGALPVHIGLRKPVPAEIAQTRGFGVVAAAEAPIFSHPRIWPLCQR